MKTGCLFTIDERDYIYNPPGASLKEFPTTFVLPKLKVKNQNDVASCVACSLALIKEYQERYERDNWKDDYEFSIGWIYGHRDPNQYSGIGMMPREALSNLIKYGDVLNKYFPENKEYTDLKPYVEKRKADCIAHGKPFKCSAYAKITRTTDVKESIYKHHSPAMIIYEVYEDFYDLKKPYTANVSKLKNVETHAMCIIGWKAINNKEYYIVQNSWGYEWGDNGTCYIRTDDPKILELYTITDIINTKRGNAQ